MKASVLNNALPMSIQADDCPRESHDEDMNWILEKLTDRSGGGFGIMYRFVEDEPEAMILARCTVFLDLSMATCGRIERLVRGRSLDHDPTSEVMFQTSLLEASEEAPALRLLHLRFEPAPGIVVVAAICRSEKTALLMRAAIARRLYPVLARYVKLWWLHRTEHRRAAAFAQAMDIGDLGILLLDRRGSVVFENPSATQFLDLKEGVHRLGSTISASRVEEGVALQAAMNHAVLQNRFAQSHCGGASTVVLSRNGRRALIVTVSCVRRRAIDPGDPAVTVYVLDPEHDVALTIGPACRLYGLTSAESRLVNQLVTGATLTESATTMHVGVQTARSYLKQVFQKTSTNRQAELVRLLLASAVRGRLGINLGPI